MKVKKHYEQDKVIVYAGEDQFATVLTFDDEPQMQRLGECLKDLARGAQSVELSKPHQP